MKQYQYKTNINCGGCIATVAPYLEKLKGLKHWKVDTDSKDKVLTIETDNPKEVEEAVREAGYELEPRKNRLFKLF